MTSPLNWYGLEVLSVHEPEDPPIEEFLDDGFVEDWLGIESSVFLVSAPNEERARALIEDEVAHVSVNIYGQRVRQRVVTADLYRIAAWEFPPRESEFVLEVYSNLWNATRGTDPEAFVRGGRPEPDDQLPMIAPISVHEHAERYVELRGPLPE